MRQRILSNVRASLPNHQEVTIAEGAWTDVQIPLSELGNPTNITELFFQNANFTGVIYIDHIGLK